MNENEFKEAIKEILSESRGAIHAKFRRLLEFGDEFGDVDLGNWSDLSKLAGSPNDVVKATMGSVSNVANKVRTLLTMVLKGIPTLVVPFVRTKYEQILEQEKHRHNEIERMYPDIFSIARKGFPKDGELFTFMLNPPLLMTWALARLGSDVTLDLIDALSGQAPSVVTKTKVLRRRTARNEWKSLSSVIFEAPGTTSDKHAVAQLIKDRGFLNEFGNSGVVNEIAESVKASKNTTLNEIIEVARDITSAASVDDLETLGINFKLDPQKKKQLEDAGEIDKLAIEAKSSAVEELIKTVDTMIGEFNDAGVPDNADIFKALKRTKVRLNQQLKSVDQPQPSEKKQTPEPGSNGGVKQPPPVA